jgi:FtsP/CotA-like multicopper oxidase with cupredoxin domain
MNARQTTRKLCRTPALLALVLPLVAGNAAAATYNLVAMPFGKTMPDGTPVLMWGFSPDDGAFVPSAPGPALVVPAGDSSLTINLRNFLSEPVSIIIPGQAMPSTSLGSGPVKFTDSQGRQRVRSFTAEAAAFGGTRSYTWNNLKPGTYLYHSGTHPQVQVQMGLYGAVTRDAAAGQAYAGVPYSSQATLLFSEVDPVLHAAVAAGRYGQPAPDPLPLGLTAADYPSSTIDYAPKYFLINGEPYTSSSLPVAAGNAGQTTLVRMLNAGLQSRSPVLQGHYMRLVAEDGNPYPYAREQYSAFLPALKTVDAVITPAAAATYPIYDRRLADGMLAFLAVAEASTGTPLASNDDHATNEDAPLVVAAPGVLGNDGAYADDPTGTTASWLSGPSHGTVNLATDGSFTYTPAPNYNGADSFTYQAVSGGSQSLPATVSLTVNPANDAPVAAGNAYSVAAGDTLNVAAPGVLGNDSDIDGDTLSAVNHSALAGLTPSADGGFSYNAPATAGEVSFTYQASDGVATSDPASVVITVTAAAPNTAPVAVKDTFTVARNSTGNILNVLANDSDPDGNLDPGTVAIVVAPNKGGSATPNPDGTVSYTPRLNFRGSENFSYRVRDTGGLWSNTVTVKVNVK